MPLTFTERIRRIPTYHYIAVLSVLAAVTVIYCFTGLWPWKGNGYNSYAIQAQAWLDGHLDIGEDRPWLELAIYEGKYFVSFPPFPSYVLLPFAAIFGENTPDHFIALAVTVTGVIYAAKIYEKLISDTSRLIFYVLFLYLSSGFLFIGITGYVWFIAQNLCFTLSLMSIYYALQGRGGLSLTFWACAVGCRPMTIVWLPLLVILIWKSYFGKKLITLLRNRWYWAIAPIIIAASYMILNYRRFGSVIEFGHNYLPEFTRTETGQFNIAYLIPNIKNLLRLPEISEESSALTFPTAEGFAFYIASTIFIAILIAWGYSLALLIRSRSRSNISRANSSTKEASSGHIIAPSLLILILVPVLTAAHVLFICLHKTLGGWGFGNRYLLDTLPWLYYAYLLWKPKSDKFDRWMLPLMIFGAGLNIVGTIATYNYWL